MEGKRTVNMSEYFWNERLKIALHEQLMHRRVAKKWIYAALISFSFSGLLAFGFMVSFYFALFFFFLFSAVIYIPIVMIIDNYWDWCDKSRDIKQDIQKAAEKYIEETQINQREA